MKKVREEIEFKGSGGFFDAFDDYVKGIYNITDEEYDYIVEKMDEVELAIFCDACGLGGNESSVTFSTIRRGLEIRNKYLKQFNKQNDMNDEIEDELERVKLKYSDLDVEEIITEILRDTNYEFMGERLISSFKNYYISKTEREHAKI